MHVDKLIASFTLTLCEFIVFICMNWVNQFAFSANWSFEVDAVEHVVKVYRHLSVTNMIGGVHKGLTCLATHILNSVFFLLILFVHWNLSQSRSSEMTRQASTASSSANQRNCSITFSRIRPPHKVTGLIAVRKHIARHTSNAMHVNSKIKRNPKINIIKINHKFWIALWNVYGHFSFINYFPLPNLFSRILVTFTSWKNFVDNCCVAHAVHQIHRLHFVNYCLITCSQERNGTNENKKVHTTGDGE